MNYIYIYLMNNDEKKELIDDIQKDLVSMCFE